MRNSLLIILLNNSLGCIIPRYFYEKIADYFLVKTISFSSSNEAVAVPLRKTYLRKDFCSNVATIINIRVN